MEEEAAVEIDLDTLQVVGGWLIKKLHKTEKNSKYPDLAYQLLFIADIKKVNEFKERFEVHQRIFVPIKDVINYAGGPNFIPIFNYVVDTYPERFTKQTEEKRKKVSVFS